MQTQLSEETVIELIQTIHLTRNVEIIRQILTFVANTTFNQNHDAIINALKVALASLPEGDSWAPSFKATIANVRIQKEAAEKIVIYKGPLTYDELFTFMEESSRIFIYPTINRSLIKLSMQTDDNSDLIHVMISSELGAHLDNYFGSEGYFNGCEWLKKFTRIPALPKEKTEKSNSVTLPSGDVLSFRDGRWWITRSRGGGIEECLRSEAHNLLRQNCLVNAITEEAWADIVKPDLPLLS